MPAVIAGYIVSAVLGGAVVTATTFAIVTAAIYVGVYGAFIYASIAYSSAQSRKLKNALNSALGSQNTAIDQGRNVMVRDPISPRRVIYGQIPVSGPIIFWEVNGTNNQYLYLVVVLASHECEELGEIRFENEVIPLDGSGNATGTYAGYVRIVKFLGVTAGERDLTFESELPGLWTSAHVGKGVARLHVRLTHNPDLFVNGLPTITCMVKGKKVYDPRSATTVYSANSALCFGDFLMDGKFGKGVALDRIRSAEWIAAANICDEDVVLADASTEKRYTCNGAATADQDPDGTLLDIASSMAGGWSDPGGLWKIWAGAWRPPTVTLGDGDLCGSFSVVPRQSRQDTYNGVKGTFISAINQWTPSDFPAVKNDTYMTWDGGKRLWKDVVYNFTTSAATAQRLAKIDLEVGRQQIVYTGDYMLKAVEVECGDVMQINRPRLGWSGKYFEAAKWGFKVMQADGGPALAISITGRETAEGVYDWADGAETTVDLAPNTSIVNPRAVVAPTGLTLSDGSFVQPDNSTMPRLKLEWDASADSQVLAGGFVETEYKKHADSVWLPWSTLPGDRTEDYILDINGDVQYDVRIRFRNVFGVRSSFSSASTSSGGVSVPPGGAAVLGSASGSSTVSGTSPTLVSALQVTVTLDAAKHVISFSGYVANASGSANSLTLYIYRNGSSIGSLVIGTLAAGASFPITLIVADQPGASSPTYSIYLQGSNTNNMVAGGTLIVT